MKLYADTLQSRIDELEKQKDELKMKNKSLIEVRKFHNFKFLT